MPVYIEKKWRFGRIIPKRDGQTKRKDRATQPINGPWAAEMSNSSSNQKSFQEQIVIGAVLL